MLIMCTNMGCMQSSNAKLNEETKEVICMECGNPIIGITDAMKRTLKSFGKVIRSSQRKAFMLACQTCLGNREIALDENNKTVCKVCHNDINVTPSFRLAMEENGVKLEKLEKEESKTKKTRGRPKIKKSK